MNCMTCSCPINTASEGWAEWIGTGEDTDDDKRKCYGFRIVHHVMASPLRVDKTRGTGCYWPQEVMPPGHAPCDHHLDFFIDNQRWSKIYSYSTTSGMKEIK